jgi:hypothetical protein
LITATHPWSGISTLTPSPTRSNHDLRRNEWKNDKEIIPVTLPHRIVGTIQSEEEKKFCAQNLLFLEALVSTSMERCL